MNWNPVHLSRDQKRGDCSFEPASRGFRFLGGAFVVRLESYGKPAALRSLRGQARRGQVSVPRRSELVAHRASAQAAQVAWATWLALRGNGALLHEC